MDTELLVEGRIEDGRRLVEQLVRDGFDVTVVFWVKTSEEGAWHLFIASPSVDPEKPGGAYRQAYASLSKIPGIGISPVDIKLISDGNPIARDAVAVRGDCVPRTPTLYHGDNLGGLSTEEVYIYPPLVSLRQLYSVAYHREDDTNTWSARTRKGPLFRDVRAKGTITYSTGRWEGEVGEGENHATVSVLLEVDPQFDDESLILQPDIERILSHQAREFSDDLFISRNPDALIKHLDNNDGG